MSVESAKPWPWYLPESRTIGAFYVSGVLVSAGRTITLAVSDADGRPFAMKIPVRENAADATWRGRFEREVQILRELLGPSFPELRAFGKYAAGGYSEIPYIVTSLPIGPTLRDIIAQRKATAVRPDVGGALHLLRALASTLAEVHERGIVHRNLRPDKIAVSQGAVQICDFVLGLSPAAEELTLAHDFLGTPDYIAPEQVKSPHNVDARADLYALGLILYEYLTYERPFGAGANRVDAFLKHVTNDPPAPSTMNAEVPKDLDQTLLRLLRKNRDERFQSALDVVAHVDDLFQARRGAALSHVCLLPESGRIENFRVCEVMSTSAKAVVIRVEDPKSRSFALKVPARQSTSEGNFRARFEREVQILRDLAGPGYPTLRAFGSYAAGGLKGIPYLVTDLPIGPSLRDVLDAARARGAPPDVAGAPYLLRKLLELLVEVHARRIFAFGLRPDKVAVRGTEVQILDFMLSASAPRDAQSSSLSISSILNYIAPEMLDDGSTVDPRADLYVIGVLLYEYLTFSLPFGAVLTSADASFKLATQSPPAPSSQNRAVPPELDQIVMRLLQRAPEARFQSASDALDKLRSVLDPQGAAPPPARPSGFNRPP